LKVSYAFTNFIFIKNDPFLMKIKFTKKKCKTKKKN
jgi:hypothetical protein